MKDAAADRVNGNAEDCKLAARLGDWGDGGEFVGCTAVRVEVRSE